MTIKQNLFNLYASKWDEFALQLEQNNHNDNFAMPFLIDAPESFDNHFKVMIYGQETWGWHDGVNLDGWLKKGMQGYKSFFGTKNFMMAICVVHFRKHLGFMKKIFHCY